MRRLAPALAVFVAASLWSAGVAALPYERAGWEAELTTRFHGVSGTVRIIDEFTLQVDDFNYDGKGLRVFFWLDDPSATEIEFTFGYGFGSPLARPEPYVDESFLLDLGTHSLDGHRAISVWCFDARVSFGDGIFEPAAIPEPSTALLTSLGVGMMGVWRRGKRGAASLRS